jgi:hypothetical protein
MAKKSTGTRKEAASSKGLSGACRADVTELVQKGRAVQVVGRVKNGKLEIDQRNVEEFARKFPSANMTFVAVNAPFDPMRGAGNP